MLEDYPKEIMIKDGRPVTVRPLISGDESKMLDFLDTLSEEERWLLRDNFADPKILHQWLDLINYDKAIPLVALSPSKERIIAYVVIQRRLAECLRHIAHLRIMVDPIWRQRRLGTWMLLDAIQLSMRLGIEKLVAEFVSGFEDAAMNAAYKLDFYEQAVVRDYIKDREGNYRNMIIMMKTLTSDWSDF
jgi:L-amino acid N-acyltransferase YncA